MTIAALSCVAVAQSASAQSNQAAFVEQGFFREILAPKVCDIVGEATDAFLPGLIGDVIRGGGKLLGLCAQRPTSGEGREPPLVEETMDADEIVAVGQQMRPALRVSVVKVEDPDGAPRTLAAGPDTVFEAGSGFGVFLLNNSPGYLEVWSVDQTSITFIEGIVLGDPGMVALPESVSGFYRFSTSGGEDSLRLRFHPCRLGSEQAFFAEENQAVANVLSGAERQMVHAFQTTLPDCSFGAESIDRDRAQDVLFRNAPRLAPQYLDESGAYMLVVPEGEVGLVTDIALRRN